MTIEVTRLPSGLTVATDAMDGIGTASVNVYFRAGSRSEDEADHGLAHFLEHMAFKGTSRRTARGILEEMEDAGGELNATTGLEITSYEARVLGQDVPLALDLLGDILTDPTFPEEEIEREHGIVIQEISGYEDSPEELVYDMVQEVAYSGQTFGRAVLGTPESVKTLGREHLMNFRSRHYHAPDTVVVAAGAIDHNDMVRRAQDYFAGLPTTPAPAPVPAHWTGGDFRKERDLEQAHILISWPGLPIGEEETYALQVFANLVGGGMASRLFQEVREVRGLCYNIHAFHWSFTDTGLFGFYAGTAEEDVDELLATSLGEIGEAATGATEREVNRAKAQMRMSLEMAREQPVSRADRLARQLLVFDRPIPNEEVLAKLDAVTVEGVRAAAAKVIAGAPAIAAVGPVAGVWTADRIASRLGGKGAAAA